MSNLNWEAISAISNIVLSIFTFVGIMITLYVSISNSYYKIKIEFQLRDKWTVRITNKRNVPVHIRNFGIMYTNDQGKDMLIAGENCGEDSRLGWNEAKRFLMLESEVSHKLLELGEPEGKVITAYAYVKTDDGKYYKKKMTKVESRSIESGSM